MLTQPVCSRQSLSYKNHDHNINKDDRLEHLLDAHLMAQNNEFHVYIVQLKASIDDDTIT